MLTAAEREASVASTLTTAADWKAKGDVRWELTCVGGAIEALLTIAVMHHDSADAILSALTSALKDWSAGTPAPDDITLVVVRKT